LWEQKFQPISLWNIIQLLKSFLYL
jgi:hypothetical protein